jgi:hypothetical protein
VGPHVKVTDRDHGFPDKEFLLESGFLFSESIDLFSEQFLLVVIANFELIDEEHFKFVGLVQQLLVPIVILF